MSIEIMEAPAIEEVPTEEPEEVQIEQRETFDGRFYPVPVPPTKAGEEATVRYLPSVSNILSTVQVGSAFGDWTSEQAAKLGVEGARLDMLLRAERGSNVHTLCERFARGETVDWLGDDGRKLWTDWEWQRFLRFTQWMEAHDVKVRATEHTIYSLRYGYAGTCDIIAEVDGDVYVVDLKTSKYVGDHHKLQVAAYYGAVREMYPKLNIRRFGILALDVRTKIGYRWTTVEEPSELVRLYRRFLKRLELFKLDKPNFQPKIDLLPARVEPKKDEEEEEVGDES